MIWFEECLVIFQEARKGLALALFNMMSHTARLQDMLLISACLWVLIVMSLSGCSRDQHDHPDLTTGEQLFAFHCAECHGVQGSGKLFDGIPANILTKKTPDEIMTYLTTETSPDRKMPVFRTMPAEEAKVITDHLLTLQKAYDQHGSQIKQLLIEP
ncbi:MAG: cytochrome c [Nitrospirales bacterium]|nr:cytochrome c [Nitrospirales bacterium]